MQQLSSLLLIALIGIGAAVVAGLFWPLALKASQLLYDLVNRQQGSKR